MDSKFKTNNQRHKDVIVLVDNRLDRQGNSKAKTIDFRNSAFKQTQVDPLQPRPDINCLNEQDMILTSLKRKVFQLQKRVMKLEHQNHRETNSHITNEAEGKKKRRKFSQLTRSFRCSHPECEKLYGSETSLKNHLKLKHSQTKANY